MKQLNFEYYSLEDIIDNIGHENLELLVYEDGELEIAASGCIPYGNVVIRKPLALWYWKDTLAEYDLEDEYELKELKEYIKDTLEYEFNLCE